MEYFNNVLCVSQSELIMAGLTKTSYVNLYNRQRIQVLRRGCNSTPALISYESLPVRIKEDFVKKYGDPKTAALASPFKNNWEYDGIAADFYNRHKLSNGEHLPPEKINEYTATASALNTIQKVLSARKAKRNALGGTTRGLIETEIATVIALQTEYGYNLPHSGKRLQAKLLDYQKNGYISLVHKNFCNSSSAKVLETEQQAFLRRLLSDHRNLNNEQIKRLYNDVAERLPDWKKITGYTVAARREEWNLHTLSGRRGETTFNNTLAMQIKRKAPSAPLLYWTLDAWDVELLYQRPGTNKDGKTLTSYHHRPTVVVILDPFNKYPVGYAIGTHETPDLIREALRNAVDHTVDLFGERFKPYQLQSDRYSLKSLKPFYEAATKIFTPARVKNAKGKVIEPYFKEINVRYCQAYPNWSGFNVNAEKDHQPNQEYLNKIRHSFPDQTSCYNDVKRIIMLERKDKHAAFMEAWHKAPADHKLRLDDEAYLYHMGESTERSNRFESKGLIKIINKAKYVYDSFDPRFRAYAHIDWIVKYNPADMSKVLAHNEDGTLRFMLEEKYIQPMALADRLPGDAEAKQLVDSYNKSLKDAIMLGMANDNQTVDWLFMKNPELKDTLAKAMIVDSAGQHKDRRNGGRISPVAAAAKKINQRHEAKELKKVEKSMHELRNEYINSKVDLSKYNL